MQDTYIGDIGDYGKYGLLRAITAAGISLSVNWYKVVPKKFNKQDDGKYIQYLLKPEKYQEYDCFLFESLYNIVYRDNDRSIQRIEQENLFSSKYFSDEITTDRLTWHQKALRQTSGTDAIFLDPDNGLETHNMFVTNAATEKHVKWLELKDYYQRGQTVILYQHRPQMKKKEVCINEVLQFQKEYLKADSVMLLEFPKYTNRFYFMFLHSEHHSAFSKACNFTIQNWGKDGFCKEILI